MRHEIEALLFDLGGVVIDIDIERMLQHWLPYSALDLAQMRERLYPDDAYRRHELGDLDGPAYMKHLAEVFELTADTASVAAGWNAMLANQIDQTLDLVEAVNDRIPCHVFSNTSALHHRVWAHRFPRIHRLFDRLFLSFEIGMRKPEPAAFAAVTQAIGVEPESILFFDDLAENVAGARAAGLRATQVRSPADVARVLDELGLIGRVEPLAP